jgi:hypothetical protein
MVGRARAEVETPAPATTPIETPKKTDDGPPAPTIGGQVHVRYELSDGAREPDAGELSLARAKVELTWEPDKRLEAVVAADVSPPATTGGSGVVPLDATVQVEAQKWLRVRAGHRKIPFSALRLQSLSRLPTIVRGEYSEQLGAVFHDEGPADLAREVGVDLRLRARRLARLRWDIGVSQGEDGPKDVATRATVRPAGGLEVGAALAVVHVFAAVGSAAESQVRALGEVDAALDAGGWHFAIESATGDDDRTRGDRWFLAGYALVSYRAALGDGETPALEPLVRFDAVDRGRGVADDHALGLTAGLNLHVFETLRLMFDVERVERAAAYGAPDETRFLSQIAFDL